MTPEWGIARMYMAYVDDSGATNDEQRFSVFAAVIIPAESFFIIEGMTAVGQQIFKRDGYKSFPEFHARDLFLGEKAFRDVPEKLRHEAIAMGMAIFSMSKATIVYGAVDRQKLEETDFRSVNAADLAFTYCLKGIDRYVESMEQLQATEQAYLRVTTRDPKIRPNYNDLCLLILDDTGDNALKNRLKKTYRAMRKRVTEQFGDRGKLLHFHDSLYFGDSTDSIGIQLADLCAYFIGVHKSRSHDDKGEEVSRKSEEFYRMFDKCIFHSEIFPEAKS